MDINVSQVMAFQRCELDWYYQYVMKRVRRGWSVPLKVGDWWHRVMECYFVAFQSHAPRDTYDANPIQTALRAGADLMVEMVTEAEIGGFHKQALEFSDECSKLLDLFENHWMLRFPPSSILTIEEPVRRRLPNAVDALKESDHWLVGIPDTVVMLHNQRWHLQHKTASDRTPMELFVRLAQRSLHELCYAWLLEGKVLQIDIDDPDVYGTENYAGTYLNIVRKLSKKAITTNPQSAFVQELIPLDPKQIFQAILDVSRTADRMAAITRGDASPIDNRDADGGRFGNSLSPYFDVKLGIETLRDDHLFTDFVSRYE